MIDKAAPLARRARTADNRAMANDHRTGPRTRTSRTRLTVSVGTSLLSASLSTGCGWLVTTNPGPDDTEFPPLESGTAEDSETGGTDTGGTESGATETGDTETGDTETGATETGATETGAG